MSDSAATPPPPATPAARSDTAWHGAEAGRIDPPFERLLVANRGEIAVRITRTARRMGIHTIAVYSDADADALHVRVADEAVAIGPAPASQSYLDVDAVVAAAVRSGAQAVHPGYGFLAEHAGFAQACADADLVLVGPPARAIAVMGDKSVARDRMSRAGVPILAGHNGGSDDDIMAAASDIGFPVMVKASSGGGGTGLRRVDDPVDLPDALAGVRREANAAFGSDHLIVERAVDDARHVEVQILSDHHGRVVALGDRDCSVQRRHQKVVEEAPAPDVPAAVRAAMADAAVTAATDVGYVGAGTVEFLLAPDDTFAFLEMNTRLQVEHTVTELVLGLDLVEWQLRVAAGEPLPAQQPPPPCGHAIEARLYAEDPAADFLPRTGTIVTWRAPEGPGVRVDTGIADTSTVGSHYDPLLAKIIAHGHDRDQARRRLVAALEDTVAQGVVTNRGFLLAVLDHASFEAGPVSTRWLGEAAVMGARPSSDEVAAVARWLHMARERDADQRSPGLAGWSSRGWTRSRQRLRLDGDTWDIEVQRTAEGVAVTAVPATGSTSADNAHPRRDDRAAASDDGRASRSERATDGERATAGDSPRPTGDEPDVTALRPRPDRVLAHLPRLDIDATDVLQAPPAPRHAGGGGIVTAPMHGVIAAVAVAVGDTVARGDDLVTLEAMKMEHRLRAPIAGVVTHVVAATTQAAMDDVVVRLEAPTSSHASDKDTATRESGSP